MPELQEGTLDKCGFPHVLRNIEVNTKFSNKVLNIQGQKKNQKLQLLFPHTV